jgi:hypothetical protein
MGQSVAIDGMNVPKIWRLKRLEAAKESCCRCQVPPRCMSSWQKMVGQSPIKCVAHQQAELGLLGAMADADRELLVRGIRLRRSRCHHGSVSASGRRQVNRRIRLGVVKEMRRLGRNATFRTVSFE